MQIDGLNPPQREAVEHGDGPLLILAGAGSGKTRVITHRLARLVDRNVVPWRILAVTFTNKAAGEMRQRAGLLVSEERARKMWIGTFHSTCARLLRLHAEEAGLRPDFLIFDDDDQKRLVTRIMKDLVMDERAMSPRAMMSKIDHAKNEGIDAANYAPDSYQEELVARVYVEYQQRMRAANGVDFGDLLVETLKLFDKPEASAALRRKFDHVLVDEFQDTNRVQYRIVQKLAAAGNLCVVGDDDQAIYKWRGADVRNILDFERDYPGCKVVKLEQNYRSTEIVLQAANGVISRNLHRKSKKLFTEIAGGDPIIYFTGSDEKREAEFITRAMKQLIAAEGRSIRDFAVLYRMHAQSRALEEALRANNLPYKIYGGVRFFDRAEVKDLLGYLRVIANPADEVSLERIVNVPPRGIGDTTLDRVAAHAKARRISRWEAMREAAGLDGESAPAKSIEKRARKAANDSGAATSTKTSRSASSTPTTQIGLFGSLDPVHAPPSPVEPEPTEFVDESPEPITYAIESEVQLGAGPRKKLAQFVQLIDGLRERLRAGASMSELAAATLDASGLLERLHADGGDEAKDRLGNLEELLNSIRDYERETDEPSLVGYLERVSLQSAADESGGGVALMTVHAAKGLEFPVVFLAGMEEGTFPMLQPGEGLEKLEEERRLAYVAITRARERLIITNAARRRLFREQRLTFETAPLDEDDPFSNRESRFISDIPEHCIARPVAPRRAAPSSVPGRRIESRDDGSYVERDEGSDGDEAPRRSLRSVPTSRTPAPAASNPNERWVDYDEGSDGEGGFRIGQRVRHEKWGEGRVRHLTGRGEGLKLVVDFSVGQKTIVARFVQPA